MLSPLHSTAQLEPHDTYAQPLVSVSSREPAARIASLNALGMYRTEISNVHKKMQHYLTTPRQVHYTL
jgi:hypothetical protein